MTPGFQWPMSSMAASPFATRPAELPAPCWAGVPRKPSLNGSMPMNSWSCSPASTKHGSSKTRSAWAACSVSGEQDCSAKWYQ